MTADNSVHYKMESFPLKATSQRLNDVGATITVK